MDLTHRFWQVVGLTLSVIAGERGWILAAIVVAIAGWLTGLMLAQAGLL